MCPLNRPLPLLLQAEVEKFYIDHGFLLPKYHMFYWMGLNTSEQQWSNFTWLTPDIDSTEYLAEFTNWGASQPEMNMDKMCAGGHYNLTRAEIWGWANHACNLPFISVCRVMREWPGWAGRRPVVLALTAAHVFSWLGRALPGIAGHQYWGLADSCPA
jgi:hypothetical protein